MAWSSLRLEEIQATTPYSFVGGPFGSNLTTRDYVEDGIPVIRGNNLPNDAAFLDEDFVFVSEEKALDLRSNLAFPGDLVFTQRGTLGQVGLIPHDARHPRYVISQSQMKLTVNSDVADARFIYYLFRLPSTVQRILNRAATSGVPHINLTTLRRLEIGLPDIRTQSRVAELLWTHDSLISANCRRIALLEDAARQLFREWFVRLRFPGHEHTPVSSGVPDGWSRLPLSALCIEGGGIQTGPFGSQLHQSDYTDDGVAVVMPKDIAHLRIDTGSTARISSDLANRLSRHRLEVGDTVYGRRGDIGRRAYVGPRQAGALCGTGCLRLRPDPAVISPIFFFDALGSPETAGTIANRAKGATMPNLNATVLRSVPALVPPRRLQDLYAEQVETMMSMTDVLELQTDRLKSARDLLLPRLMSGELTV